MSDDDDLPNLGPCCICSGNEVTAIVMLDRRCAVPGHGWGCPVCGLPMDGASAVLCDKCLTLYQADGSILVTACRGYPATDGRITIAELPPGKFEHDMEKHGMPEFRLSPVKPPVEVTLHPPKQRPSITARTGFNWSAVNWGAPDQQRTDRCSYCGDPFPDDEEAGDFVPLMMWNAEGWCAEFCDHCQAAWFGIQSFPDPPDEGPADG